MRGRSRSRDRVAREYDAGNWDVVRRQQRWDTASDLAEVLVGDSSASTVRKLDGALRRVADPDYQRWRMSTVQHLVRDCAGDSPQVVELGCGWGANLFALSLVDRWSSLVGLDISPNGLASARAIAERYSVAGARFGPIDLTDPAHESWSELRGATVFTLYSLEQIPDHLESALTSIARAGPQRVIHIESASGMLDMRKPLDVLNALYLRSVSYQTELVRILDSWAEAGRIRLLRRERLNFGDTIHNEPGLVVWEPLLP